MKEVVLLEMFPMQEMLSFFYKESFFCLLSFVFVFIAVMIDLQSAIRRVKALKGTMRSRSFRKSTWKVMEYFSLIFFGIVVDVTIAVVWRHVPVGVMLLCLAACMIEMFSVVENYRAKKSSAGKLLEMAQKIIETTSKEEAVRLIEELRRETNNKDK